MALSVGNLLDTGCEKADLIRFFYTYLIHYKSIITDFIHLHFIHFNAIFYTYLIH